MTAPVHPLPTVEQAPTWWAPRWQQYDALDPCTVCGDMAPLQYRRGLRGAVTLRSLRCSACHYTTTTEEQP